MNNIEISRPRIDEVELINEFFKLVIHDTFMRNNISDLVDTLANEIEDKRRCLNQDMESNGKNRYFLVAKDGREIIGSIEYGPSNELINLCTKGELKDIVEIGTVYVHPNYQGNGLGSRLMEAIFMELKHNGILEFCFDSGYKSAQKIWINKFGKPQYHFKDYWGENEDHMIWRIQLKDVLK